MTEEWIWSDSALELEHSVVWMTDDLFDSQVNSKQWLVFFVFDRYNPKYSSTLQFVHKLMTEVSVRVPSTIQVAFVDVMDNGELLKETFDIESTPSAIYIKDGLVYYMPQQVPNKITWLASDFSDFIDVNHKKERSNFLRPRVTPGFSLYKEYTARWLAETYFDEIMP